MAESCLGAGLIDGGLLECNLWSDRRPGEGELLLLDSIDRLGLLGGHLEQLDVQFRVQAVLQQLIFNLGLEMGLGVSCFGGRRIGLGLKDGSLELGVGIRQIGFGGLELRVSVEGCLFDGRVAELKNDAVGLYGCARMENDPIHVGVGTGRDPADILRDQGAQAVHFPDHRTPFDGVDPHQAPFHGGHGWFEAGEEDRYANQCHDDNAADCDPAS